MNLPQSGTEHVILSSQEDPLPHMKLLTDEPVIDDLVTDDPVTGEPATDKPVTDNPVTEETVATSSSELPFVCWQCNNEFSSFAALTEHVDTHAAFATARRHHR